MCAGNIIIHFKNNTYMKVNLVAVCLIVGLIAATVVNMRKSLVLETDNRSTTLLVFGEDSVIELVGVYFGSIQPAPSSVVCDIAVNRGGDDIRKEVFTPANTYPHTRARVEELVDSLKRYGYLFLARFAEGELVALGAASPADPHKGKVFWTR